jgi:hypothetical protein
MNNYHPLSQPLSQDRLRSMIETTLAASKSARFDVDTNLQLLDFAWEAQKRLWASQELTA